METPTEFDYLERLASFEAQLNNLQAVGAAPQPKGGDDISYELLVYREVFEQAKSNYISIGDSEIYQRTATHYVRTSKPILHRKAFKYVQQEYPKQAKPKLVEDVVKFLVMDTAIDGETWSTRVNPDGYLNCMNGVLRVLPIGVKLLDRDDDEVKDFIFLDRPVVSYDPDACRSHAERLMFGCLEGESRNLYQRVMGASLNVSAVRRLQSRLPGLISPGTSGSNGKSVNNELVARIHGPSAVAYLGLEYFKSKAGDDPSRNDLWKLAGKKLNIPPESVASVNISSSPTLKATVTGDTITSRGLFKDAFSFAPRCVMHFSLNSSTIANAADEATTTRWRFLKWPFSFVKQPDLNQPHQKPVDGRYNPAGGDFSFIDNEVLPGYLNLLIDGFMDACAIGFPTDESSEIAGANAADTDHVSKFMRDMGLKSVGDSAVPMLTSTQIHQLYLFWLYQYELDSGDERRNSMVFAGGKLTVHSQREFAFGDSFNGLKATTTSLMKHLKQHKHVSSFRPNPKQCEQRCIPRKEYCWLVLDNPAEPTPEMLAALKNLAIDYPGLDKALMVNIPYATRDFKPVDQA